MAQHSLEEIFHRIAPPRRGIPSAPTLTAGVTSVPGELATSLSQAGSEIAQLRAGYQQQAELIQANTQALQNNTAGQASHSAGSTVGSAVSGVLGGALGFLSPVISGLMHLFGGGPQAPPSLPVYMPPPPVSIGGILHGGMASESGAAPAANAPGGSGPVAAPSTYAPQITVQVSAMDSQSFMDRSGDIANAVRQAMLNNHPINGVVADL